MKRLVYTVVLLVSFSIFYSCEKDPVTDIEKIEQELSDFVKDNDIKLCSIVLMYGETTYVEHSLSSFEIDGGFVRVEGDRYNLLYLSKYTHYGDSEMALYFANTHF